MKYIGLDVSKKFSYLTVMDEKGTIELQGKVGNKLAELEVCFEKIGGDCSLAMEATRNWYYLYEALEAKVKEIHLAHPLKVRAIAEARIKTDKIDSKILADLLRANLLPESYIPTQAVRDQREQLRYRASLVSLQTQIKNKVHALLDKNGLFCPYSDLFGGRGMNWLLEQDLREVYAEELKGYLEVLETLKEEIAEAGRNILHKAQQSPEAKLIQTMPGAGYYLSMLIAAEIGDIHRFPDPHKLSSFAGLVPSTYASGEVMRHGRITKQGSKWLRWAMIEAAQRAPINSPKLNSFFQRIAKKQGRKTARVALARHMLKIVYHMLKERQPFAEGSERPAIA